MCLGVFRFGVFRCSGGEVLKVEDILEGQKGHQGGRAQKRPKFNMR